MKKLLIALFLLTIPLSLLAAPIDVAALKKYAQQSVGRCPDAIVTLEPVNQAGPLNFVIYDVRVKSSDENCNARKYLAYSPSTQQIILGSVFALPSEGKSVTERIVEQGTKLLQQPVTATVAPFPLPDGLKSVAITRPTQYGPFSYHGYVDASERFLLVGTRGNLHTPPSVTLRDAIGAQNAVRRGNPKAKVEIIELSDFECPTCGRAHKSIFPVIEKNLSKINFGRIDLPLFEHHEWAMPAALGAKAILRVAPKSYWTYVDYMFKNQEDISKQPFDKVLQDFCEDHDIPWSKVVPIYRSPQERQAMLDQVSRAFDNNINATPTFLINGEPTDYGPNGEYVLKQIKAAVGAK